MSDNRKRFGTLTTWLGLLVLFFLLFAYFQPPPPLPVRPFAAFLKDLEGGRVDSVRLNHGQVIVRLQKDGGKYATDGTLTNQLIREIHQQGVPINYGEEEQDPWHNILFWGIVLFVVFFVVILLLRRSRGSTMEFLAMRKTKARLLPQEAKVTFAEVGGCDEAKLLLGDLVDFLRNPKRWAQAGVRVPRGVLLEGPPGCGKTLLARAVAGETKAKFYLSAASEFVEMFVGVGAARVRDTFDLARKNAPAVIFIDELDAVGRRRGSGIGSSHDEREQTLNQLLICMDGFENRDPVVVIAATNRPDILDSALVRPGRFDRRIKIPPLCREARLQVLQIHTRNKQLAGDVSLKSLADQTDGYSGAQLESLANEAALLAVRRACRADGQAVVVQMSDFLESLKPEVERSRLLNKLDAVLIESTTQLAEPTGRAVVRVVLDGDCLQGDLVWVDANFLKIRTERAEIVVPKLQVRQIEVLAGTEAADPTDVVADPWARRNLGTM